VRASELAIAVSPNTCLTGFFAGCFLGFHSVYGSGIAGQTFFVQTFAWASWLDPDVVAQPAGIADATALSHEISEWLNDPFIGNITPEWSFPEHPFLCQNNLETGDPIELTPDPIFPVTINGYTYHPQTEALLQWFTRESPSSAYQGAYSYPDTAALSGPADACLPLPPPGPPPTDPPPPPPPQLRAGP
jgi:hypothetical protein